MLAGDLQAGITVGVMLVPQGMAYALLAGLPPIYGLYAGIIPPIIYAFFGTSRQLSVGPTALASLLVVAGLSEVVSPDNVDLYFAMAVTTALLAGIIQMLLGLFRLGFLVNFLSHPVLIGFTSAAAVIIGLSQLSNVLGINIPRSNYIQDILYHAYLNITETNWPTLLLSLSGIALIYGLKRYNRSIPGALISVVLGTLIVWGFNLRDQGVGIVGNVPEGLPVFELPSLGLRDTQQLFSLSVTIAIISFIESLAIGTAIGKKSKDSKIFPNQELLALGFSKIVGAFFQAFPTTGSFTRSAVNHEAGAKTGISSIIMALVLSLTLLFLTPLFYYLPKGILASIIVAATFSLINFKEAKYLWKIHRPDFYLFLITFLSTLMLGIQQGILMGVVLSIVSMIYRTSKPHVAMLGRLPETKHFRNISRFPDALQNERVIILRFDAQLFFGNANYFKETIENFLAKKAETTDVLVLDASSMYDIDSSGAHALSEAIDYVRTKDTAFCIAGCIGPVRDFLKNSGLWDKIGDAHHFMDVHDAMEFFNNKKLN